MFHKGARRTGESFKATIHDATHGEFSLHSKRVKAILLIVIIGLGLLIATDQMLKTGEATHLAGSGLREQELWQGNDDLDSGWNQRLVTYRTTSPCSVGVPCFRLDANSTHSAVMISQDPFVLDTVVGQNLALWGDDWFDNVPNVGDQWAFFLTRNSTIPNESGSWTPYSDPDVAFLFMLENKGSAQLDVIVWMQRDPLVSIGTADIIGCGRGGTPFRCASTTDWNFGSAGLQNTWEMVLNFTGAANTGGATGASVITYGRALLGDTCADNNHVCVFDLPWLPVEGQQYYWGYYLEINGSQLDLEIGRTQALRQKWFSFDTTIDTGGFFGPLIRVLITIIEPVLRFLASVLGTVADAFVDGMDVVGRFFGIGNIGTAIRSFLTGIADFIVNVVGTVFGWSVTFASLFTNGITFFANFLSGSNGFIAWIVSFFTSIAGIFAIIQEFWNALNTVVLGMNSILVFYYLIGMFMVYMDGWPGFKQWLEIGTTLVLSIIKGGWWIGREMSQVVLDVKRLLAQWI